VRDGFQVVSRTSACEEEVEVVVVTGVSAASVPVKRSRLPMFRRELIDGAGRSILE